MNKPLLLQVAMLFFVLLGCRETRAGDFGIYLLAEDRPATELAESELEFIELQRQPVIGADDIVSYDQKSHRMKLTGEAFQRVQALFTLPVRVDGIPFVVCVGDERVYSGALWTPASSLIYDGVIIMDPFGREGNTIGLALGYPSPLAYAGNDPRGDPRILEALDAAGKLKH